MPEVVNGVRRVVCALGVMLCTLFCMLLCTLEAVEGELRLLEVPERCVTCRRPNGVRNVL